MKRIQLGKRGTKLPSNTMNVTQGAYASPFTAGQLYFVMDPLRHRQGAPLSTGEWHQMTPEDVVDCYRSWLSHQVGSSGYTLAYQALTDLAGMDLACSCPLTNPDGSPYPCHADVLLELFADPTEDTIITFHRKTLTVAEWAKKLDVPAASILERLSAGKVGGDALTDDFVDLMRAAKS